MGGVFDIIRSTPEPARITKSLDVYNKEVRNKDSVFAITSINQLIHIAQQLDDRSLQCFSISLLADQYARSRALNELSTQLHLDAIHKSEEFGLPVLTAMCNYRMGRYYYNFKNYPLAFEYLLRADNMFREHGYKEVPDMAEILFFMGSIYYESADYEKAETYLQRIQLLPVISDYVQKQSLNTLALIKRQNGDTAQALIYFEKTLAISQQQKDTTWIGICYSNIGTLYFYSGRYAEAYPLLQQGGVIGAAHKQWGDAYTNLLLLARINIMQHRLKEAQQKIDSAIYMHAHYSTLNGRKYLYETQALYYEATGEQQKALNIQRRLLALKDSLVVSKDQQAYKKILVRMETEKHLNDIDRLEANARSAALKRNGVIVLLILVVIVLLLLYSRNRLKAKTEAAVLQGEKMRAEEQLKNARQLLQNFTKNARQKNELIEQFSAELQRLKANLAGEPMYEERIHNFEKLVHSTILTDAEWNNFRDLFDKVHKGFFIRLGQKLPGLSVSDTRLISLVKLGLGNAEMAKMMGMQEVFIEESKQRLREKIHPEHDGLAIDDLVHAI